MLVVSLVLAAVLLTGGDGSEAPPVAAADVTPATATAEPDVSPTAPTAVERPTPVPALPFELQERLNKLPEKLRNQTQYAYGTGSLTQEQLQQIVTDYENRNPAVRVGTVLDVEGSMLRFEVFTTGETAAVTTGEQTLIRRSDKEIDLSDLQPGELVMVVSTDEGRFALTIEAFGVAAP